MYRFVPRLEVGTTNLTKQFVIILLKLVLVLDINFSFVKGLQVKSLQMHDLVVNYLF